MTGVTLERELKLRPDDDFSLARLDARWDDYVTAPLEARRLHTLYYDTPDLRLTRWGCSLRLRRGEGWTLKLPMPGRDGALYREEHVFPESGDAVPAGALDLATAYLRGAAPKPVAELRTLRTTRRVLTHAGDAVAEIAEDDVRVIEGTHVTVHFRQIEVELAEGAQDGVLGAIGEVLRESGAGEPDPVPKSVRALGPRARSPELSAEPPTRASSIGEVVRAALAGAVERIVRYDAKLRAAPDEEAVHHARTAVRRLRSDLRTFRGVLERPWADRMRERLAWLQDGLSAARDADVLIASVATHVAALADGDRRRADDVLSPLRDARAQAYGAVGLMLRDARYVALLAAIVDGAKHPPFARDDGEPGRHAARAIVRRVWKRLRARVRGRSRPPSNRELHGVRIAAKQVRYAAEAFACVSGRRARRLARAAESLQTVLGEQHDAVVANERLHELARTGEPGFVAGELAALAQLAAREGSARWTRPWRRVKRAGRRFTRG